MHDVMHHGMQAAPRYRRPRAGHNPNPNQEEGTPVDIGALRQKLDRYFIGSATGDGMGMWEGSVAEVRLWNYAHSEDDIKDNMRKVIAVLALRL